MADTSHKGRSYLLWSPVIGWGQFPGIDYGSTFSPVCRLQSIRMVLPIAAEYNLECCQLDYNTAFLNVGVTEEVFVKMTPGYEQIRRKMSLTGNETFEKPMPPPPEPNGLVGHDRRTSGGNWFKKFQVGPVRLHLLGERRHLHPDPVRRRRSHARKIPPGAEADQAEAGESFLNDGHRRRATRARDGCYP
ncbi:unnamed protein product [Laminaria digitata]